MATAESRRTPLSSPAQAVCGKSSSSQASSLPPQALYSESTVSMPWSMPGPSWVPQVLTCRFPVQEAAAVALASAVNFISNHPGGIDLIRWVLFDQHTYAAYAATLAAIAMENDDLRLM